MDKKKSTHTIDQSPLNEDGGDRQVFLYWDDEILVDEVKRFKDTMKFNAIIERNKPEDHKL